jgi:hypothetical protein
MGFPFYFFDVFSEILANNMHFTGFLRADKCVG